MNPLGGLPEMHRGGVVAPGDGLVGGPRGGGHGVPTLRELPGYIKVHNNSNVSIQFTYFILLKLILIQI